MFPLKIATEEKGRAKKIDSNIPHISFESPLAVVVNCKKMWKSKPLSAEDAEISSRGPFSTTHVCLQM